MLTFNNDYTRTVRLLQAARLSKAKDSSTSIDKQDDEMRRWAQARGHEIVATTVDTDVSGDVSPWLRPEFGPWLNSPEKIGQYDGIVAAHLDRLGRSTHDFMELLQWADKNGKTIITTALGDTVDFSTGVGKLIGFIITWLGEEELKAIKRRTSATAEWLRSNGYATTWAPFGFRVVERGRHKGLEPDPETAPYVRGIVEKYLADWTLAEVCGWLEDEGVPPLRGGVWRQNTMSKMLRNPVLIGRLESRGEVVRGPDGMPLKRCEPILDQVTWRRLQAKLDGNVKPAKGPRETMMLNRVIFCRKCGGPMYRLVSRRTGRKGQQYFNEYYRCHGNPQPPSHCKNMIRSGVAEATLERLFLHEHGDTPLRERVLIPGNDVSERIEEVRDSMRTLTEDRAKRGLYRTEDGAEMFAEIYGGLERELASLRQRPAEAERWEWRDTGKTVGEHWRSLDTQGKGRFLRRWGVTMHADKDGVVTRFGWLAVDDPQRQLSEMLG